MYVETADPFSSRGLAANIWKLYDSGVSSWERCDHNSLAAINLHKGITKAIFYAIVGSYEYLRNPIPSQLCGNPMRASNDWLWCKESIKGQQNLTSRIQVERTNDEGCGGGEKFFLSRVVSSPRPPPRGLPRKFTEKNSSFPRCYSTVATPLQLHCFGQQSFKILDGATVMP